MSNNVAITYTSLALSAVPPEDETTHFYATNVNSALLVTGTNVLAVEVHQVNNTSSDISFDAELLGGRPLPPVRLGISQLGGQVVITWPNIAYAYLMQSS